MKTKEVQYGLLAGLTLLLSIGASACDFTIGAGGRPTDTGTNPVDTGTILPAPSPDATPELGSLLLFSSGLLTAGGYLGRRVRMTRRR